MAGLKFYVARALAERDKAGQVRAPGSTASFVVDEPNGSTTAVMPRGDAVDIYHGAKEILAFSTTPRNALRLAWFLLWTWWVCATWCGLKARLWNWALGSPPPPPAPPKAKPPALPPAPTRFATRVHRTVRG
jgi:hypothetical protein